MPVIEALRRAKQVLKAGDAVVAAARRPEQSPGLTGLKTEHGAALQLVKLDVNDGASLKVFLLGPRLHYWTPMKLSMDKLTGRSIAAIVRIRYSH